MIPPWVFVIFIFFLSFTGQSLGHKTWICEQQKCYKNDTSDERAVKSLGECKATCLPFGGLWPKPTGKLLVGNHTSYVDVTKIMVHRNEYPKDIVDILESVRENFRSRLRSPKEFVDYSIVDTLYPVTINLELYDPSVRYFDSSTDESYKLVVTPPKNNSDGTVNVEMNANTVFGIRHAWETLLQLFFFDDVHGVTKVLDEVYVEDKPVFPYRGIVLDTARSYVSVEDILILLKSMSVNKLNTFHWHITDSQSFPYVSKTYPQLSKMGAYSDSEVYTQEDIMLIVDKAKSLGIRVVPEFDAPAHVGEGWNALDPDLVTCFKWQPWRSYCVEPPCGQLDPTNEKVYEVLGNIFQEYVDLFHSDLFHMGGDEVNVNCWRSTPRIKAWMNERNYSQTNSGYYQLWSEYQDKVLKKLKGTKTDPHPQAILWTSTLTQPHLINKYLKSDDYIIQIWTSKADSTIKTLIENKFRVIFSNYDELYFDCGGPSWVGQPGQNWCSPYIGWQYVYEHSPHDILKNQGILLTDEIKKLVLGSEAAVWTEQIDGHNIHVRLWPRAAALAERLWSNPKEKWNDAQFRMNHHRERMLSVSPAELLQPRWCYQNDGFCD